MRKDDIKDMARQLIEDGVIPPEEEGKAIASLSKCWEDKIALVWYAEDIDRQARQMGVHMTEAQIREVLDELMEYSLEDDLASYITVGEKIREVKQEWGEPLP